jgi:two-component system chemotaxis response regulator CheB
VVGVVLSGGLDDGTAGLYTVKLRGGTAIVQDPEDAAVDAMPRNALEYTEADYLLPATAIGELLGRLVREQAPDAPALPSGEDERTRGEIRIAAGGNALREDLARFGNASPFTCPECRGALTRVTDGQVVRYRCHTGHALTRETLLGSITESIENSLYDAVRALDETVMLLKEMAAELAREGDTAAAEKLLARAREAEQRSQPVRRAARGEREPQ